MVAARLLKMHHLPTFWCDYLLLNTVVDRLIAMISNLSLVLYAIRSNASYASGVDAIGIPHVVKGSKQMQVTTKMVKYFNLPRIVDVLR